MLESKVKTNFIFVKATPRRQILLKTEDRRYMRLPQEGLDYQIVKETCKQNDNGGFDVTQTVRFYDEPKNITIKTNGDQHE